MARVVLQALVKSYPQPKGEPVPVVRGIDLTIEDKEFMVFVGPSGCGKSTTLRLIAGLDEITSGSIRIDGREVGQVAPKDRDIAMVFQNYALYPHLSVFENLAFGLRMRGVPKAEIEVRVKEAAAMLGLQDYLARLPRELSGGQRQRVAVGRAIVRQPKVFLFDEPLSNLDAKMRVATRTELVRLHRRLGATMIYVTHDQVEAMTMGDRICVMRDGCIIQVDTPLGLYHHPAHVFVAGFIGSPPMNLWPGRMVGTGLGCSFQAEGDAGAPSFRLRGGWVALVADGREVTIGVRPEALLLGSGAPANGEGFPARVERVEAMGSETLVYLQAGSCSLVARCDPSANWRSGDEPFVGFRTESIHIFDTKTGRALAPAEPSV